jgi:hypothetical protein
MEFANGFIEKHLLLDATRTGFPGLCSFFLPLLFWGEMVQRGKRGFLLEKTNPFGMSCLTKLPKLTYSWDSFFAEGVTVFAAVFCLRLLRVVPAKKRDPRGLLSRPVVPSVS